MVSGLKYGLSVGILITQQLSDRTRSTYRNFRGENPASMGNGDSFTLNVTAFICSIVRSFVEHRESTFDIELHNETLVPNFCDQCRYIMYFQNTSILGSFSFTDLKEFSDRPFKVLSAENGVRRNDIPDFGHGARPQIVYVRL